MKKFFTIRQILLMYDVPELLLVKDEVDTNYLCLLVSKTEQEWLYLSVSISSNRLLTFFRGKIDLRNVFENPEIKEYYRFTSIDTIIEAEKVYFERFPENYLPEVGFILDED